jgi:membrane protein DedA with SNARE-associated domain
VPDLHRLHDLHSTPAIAIMCFLLFVEEAGVPIPLAPGEAVLVAAGLLVAGGGAPIWLVLPLAYASVVAGATAGYLWSSRVGPAGLRGLAERLHAQGPYDRATERLRGATPGQIAASRLLPGLRVYTTLVAGAAGVPLRLFLAAILPAVAAWVLLFALLGLFVGAPAERLLGRFESFAVRAAVVAALGLLAYLLVRRVTGARVSRAIVRAGAGWRTALALGVDALTVAIVVVALSILTGLATGDYAGLVTGAGVFAALALLYLLAARRTVGFTVGEALLRTSYRA